MAPDNLLTWSLVVPVKVLARAKSRLVGLVDEERAALALAMAADTVAAALASPSLRAVIAVSDDPLVRDTLSALGALVTPDRPGAGLNAALAFGAQFAAARWPDLGLAAITADLPALATAELTTALNSASAVTQAFVADAAGTGTTLYAAGQAGDFCPRFGPQSSDSHRRAGAAELDLPATSGLRRDVDTLADLRIAASIGVGPRTARILARTG
jgi:2-phospho-L-lactate/phosphoenolpyruvate guanylyltransferase